MRINYVERVCCDPPSHETSPDLFLYGRFRFISNRRKSTWLNNSTFVVKKSV